jgi:hypothetical protein
MKKLAYTFLLASFLLSGFIATAQSNHGIIYADTNNLIVIKVYGNHYERGFAQGELLGDKITDIVQHYIMPGFGTEMAYNYIKAIVASGNLFKIDSLYVVEAKGLIDGMNSSNSNPLELDYADVLLANSMLDISGIFETMNGMQCSSLMSWGDATAGTDLDGKSVLTRHLDWTIDDVLVRNQAMVIHVPTEENEQPWAEIGFAGMISVLSGFNANIGVFQHMMVDNPNVGSQEAYYEPIWFTLRKSLEQVDPNQDGSDNVQDVAYCINQQEQGYADAYIISALARSTEVYDSLIAMVAELAPDEPYITFRSNAYPDSIPGDNLYTANSQIARNNSMNFCSRYNGIRENIGDGTDISLEGNRDLMRNYSNLSANYQFMTYAPEMDLFRVSVRDDLNTPGYDNPEVDFTISNMFESVSGIPQNKVENNIKIYPNPAGNFIHLDIGENSYFLQIIDMTGRVVDSKYMTSNTIDVSTLRKGAYSLKIFYDNKVKRAVFVKK